MAQSISHATKKARGGVPWHRLSDDDSVFPGVLVSPRSGGCAPSVPQVKGESIDAIFLALSLSDETDPPSATFSYQPTTNAPLRFVAAIANFRNTVTIRLSKSRFTLRDFIFLLCRMLEDGADRVQSLELDGATVIPSAEKLIPNQTLKGDEHEVILELFLALFGRGIKFLDLRNFGASLDRSRVIAAIANCPLIEQDAKEVMFTLPLSRTARWDEPIGHPPAPVHAMCDSVEHAPTHAADYEMRLPVPLSECAAKEFDEPRTFLRIAQVWQATQVFGQNVTVAVLDSGVDIFHPLLTHRISDHRSFVPDESPWDDYTDHGTHCAGIIGAEAVFNTQRPYMVGIAPMARLITGKVLDKDGFGPPNALAEGIRWAVAKGADIISLSLGRPELDNNEWLVVQDAITRGKFIICAATNEGAKSQYTIGFPARFGNVICVGSHSRNGRPSAFTARGREIDFLAPGEEVWSTVRNGLFACSQGTSAAVPFVTGICALILSYQRTHFPQRPISNIAQLRNILRAACSTPGSHTEDTGHGTLDPMKIFRTSVVFNDVLTNSGVP